MTRIMGKNSLCRLYECICDAVPIKLFSALMILSTNNKEHS